MNQRLMVKKISERNQLPADGALHLIEQAIPARVADRLFHALLKNIAWRAETARIMGKPIPIPRLTAWHGEASYTYSGIVHQPLPWTPGLLELKGIAEGLAGVAFNSVLLNLYRDGRDSMGWHSDDEKVLGINPVIASISLGAERAFHVRHKREKDWRLKLVLPHGSCLVMAGEMQHHWQHAVPKTTRPVGPRINLTFRKVV